MNKYFRFMPIILLIVCSCGIIPTSFWYIADKDNRIINIMGNESKANIEIYLPGQTYGCDGKNFIGHICIDSNNSEPISIKFDSLSLITNRKSIEAEILFISDKAVCFTETNGYLKDTVLLFEPHGKKSNNIRDYAIIFKNVEHYWKSNAKLIGGFKLFSGNNLIEQNVFTYNLHKQSYRAILPLN